MKTNPPTTSSTTEPSVDRTQSATVFAVSVFALSKGLPRDQVEDYVGVPLSRVIDSSHRVRGDAPPRLCAALMEEHPEDAISVELGGSMPPSFMNEVGYAMQFAPSVGDALAVSSEFVSLLADNGRFGLSRSSNFLAVDWSHPADKLDGGIMQGAVIAFLWRMLRGLTGDQIRLDEVRLSSDRIGMLDAYTDYFNTSTTFNSGLHESGFVLRKSVLEQPLVQSDPNVFDHCIRLLHERLLYLKGESSELPLSRLQTAVQQNVARGDLRATSVARSLHMSVRTAQRVAARHGTTLRKLIDEEVLTASRRLLNDPERPMHSIAEALGYSDPRAFRRAFQRVSGLSPTEFRKNRRSLERA